MSHHGYDNLTTSHVNVSNVEAPLPTYDEAVGALGGNIPPAFKQTNALRPSGAVTQQSGGAVYRPTTTRYDAFGESNDNRASTRCFTKKLVIVTLCILIVLVCIATTIVGLQKCTSSQELIKGELEQKSNAYRDCKEKSGYYEKQNSQMHSQHLHDRNVIKDLQQKIKELQEENENLHKASAVTCPTSEEFKTDSPIISATSENSKTDISKISISTERPHKKLTDEGKIIMEDVKSIQDRMKRCEQGSALRAIKDILNCYLNNLNV